MRRCTTSRPMSRCVKQCQIVPRRRRARHPDNSQTPRVARIAKVARGNPWVAHTTATFPRAWVFSPHNNPPCSEPPRMSHPLRRIMRPLLAIALLFCMAQWASASIVRDLPPGVQIPAAAQPGPNFDVDKATDAYLGLLTPEQRQLSDQYFEGGYWLQLWKLLWTVAICVALLVTGTARRMNQWSQRMSRRRWVSTLIYLCLFFVVFLLLT